MIEIKVPGKLYIAGEYAVVEPGHPAIIVAIDKFIRIKISASHTAFGTITSKQYPHQDVTWHHQNNVATPLQENDSFNYVLTAIKVTEKFISTHHSLKSFNIQINSDLDSQDGRKYGLGSSAAVTVATVEAVASFYGESLSKLTIFKLAAIAHLTVQGNGSLGDVAASVYGGWIAYSSFDRNWLKQALSSHQISDIINCDWPKLMITSLTPPDDLKLLVGWTGSAASTSKMVNKVALKNFKKSKEYQIFLQNSSKCTSNMLDDFQNNDLEAIQGEITNNRRLLNQLGNLVGLEIETPCLKKLCQIAVDNHAASKSSGAGGGDCGIVIINKNAPAEKIIAQWRSNQIQPLRFNVYKK